MVLPRMKSATWKSIWLNLINNMKNSNLQMTIWVIWLMSKSLNKRMLILNSNWKHGKIWPLPENRWRKEHISTEKRFDRVLLVLCSCSILIIIWSLDVLMSTTSFTIRKRNMKKTKKLLMIFCVNCPIRTKFWNIKSLKD